MRRTRGFSLIEVLVALALAGLVAAGALQMHSAFNVQAIRQRQIVEMQQNLRAASEVINRYIRSAGAGMEGGTLESDCGSIFDYPPIVFSNNNAFVEPIVTYDTNAGDNDADPDWIRITALDPRTGVGGTGQNGSNTVVSDTTKFSIGDFIAIIGNNPSGPHKNCLRYINRIDNSGGGGNSNAGGLDAASGQNCNNPPGGNDNCNTAANVTFPTTVMRIRATSVAFRVFPQCSTVNTAPCLMATFTVPGQTPSWQVLAENIEDLQIAVLLKDGTVCGRSGYGVDDPTDCPPTQIRAVRYTLTARSRTQITGFNLGQSGGWEDEPLASSTDGYLRRSVTNEVELRNVTQ